MKNAHDGKRRTIAGRVAVGQAAMICALVSISIVALYGFFSLKKGVERLSAEAIPQIVRGAEVAGDINQLLTDTERLLATKTDYGRRIAYTNATDDIARIRDDLQQSSFADASMHERISALEEVLVELNALISSQIEVAAQTEKAISALFSFPEGLGAFTKEMAQTQRSDKERLVISSWGTTSMRIINLVGEITTLKTLYEVKRARGNLENQFGALRDLTVTLPADDRNAAEILEKRLNALVLSRDGVVPLLIKKIEIALKNSSRGNFTRSLVVDTQSTLVTAYNRQLALAAGQTNRISDQGEVLVSVFSLLSCASLAVAGIIIWYFRQNVTKRLTHLNDAILAKIEGREASIQESGNDEISDMARSFLFYEGEVNRREEELRHMAMKDVLTGVSNRRHFMERGSEAFDVSCRYDRPFAILMIDIDHFKKINDTYGHQVGDSVLKDVAEVCQGALRGADIFGRLGGEEFAAALPETDLEEAKAVAERLRQAVADKKWDAQGETLRCTVSIGVARYEDHPDTLEFLLRQADEALYEAKESGRNCVKAA